MKPPTRIPLRLAQRTIRSIHSSIARPANVGPILGTGPPPEPPIPSVSAQNATERLERRKRQADLIRDIKQVRTSKDGRTGGIRKRFWKDVTVEKVDGSLIVYLDSRPLRHPTTKEIIYLPASKPNLALALALEWDVLTSAQQATKQHLIPLTSLVCRAVDIIKDDASDKPREDKIRAELSTSLLRYLDTDSILCWAPPAGPYDLKNDAGESLRDVQKRTAEDVVSVLATHIWPGVTLKPVLDGHSIFPNKQNEGVREIVQGWIEGLDAWEIAGLERAVLAGKSFALAARFVAEWSEGPVGLGELANTTSKFGVEEVAKASNLEVDWQASQWGEVDDTHDVNKEDVKRQLGSVVLLVSGTGKRA